MSILRGLPEKYRECDGGDFGSSCPESAYVRFFDLDRLSEKGVAISPAIPEGEEYEGFGNVTFFSIRRDVQRYYVVLSLSEVAEDGFSYKIGNIAVLDESAGVDSAWIYKLRRASAVLRQFQGEVNERWTFFREGERKDFGAMTLRLEHGKLVAYSTKGMKLVGGLPPMPEKKEGESNN